MLAALINDIFAWIILTFAIAFSENKNMALVVWVLLSNAIGIHYIFGAFIFGLVFPNGPLGVTLIERLEDFVSGLLLPLFFAIRDTEISKIDGVGTWALLVQVTVLACAGKIVGTVLVTLYYRIPIHEGVILGILMNSKGLIEMIVINIV
ncbi:Cation/H(+) antiporter 20 [Capsicum baccatum]|uniref:Cation/H(+) antiporter 20 n=1 Tax=Capsicum baccatum TaxID=33114 RepID=A0A2G2VGD0_CAPBA|nr:Cation/H(+) antiporter 20 [Capsicum baccatum]